MNWLTKPLEAVVSRQGWGPDASPWGTLTFKTSLALLSVL